MMSLFCLCAFGAQAQDIQPEPDSAALHWVPSLSASLRNIDYTAGQTGVSGQVFSLGAGMTALWGRYYLDLSGERTLRPSEETTKRLIDEKIELEREDLRFTLGYSVNEHIRVFAGYKYGRTRIAALPTSTLAGHSISLSGNGLFIGAGGGWRVGEKGLLSFSAAYADLRARYQQVPLMPPDYGQASGISLGVGWRALLADNWYYDVYLNLHQYEYDAFAQFGADISERILSIGAGLSYQF